MSKLFNLLEDACSRTLVAAHRGISGGNIPCNTLAAFDAALTNKADMIELDVGRSKDGKLSVFHEGCETAHLGVHTPFSSMNFDEIKQLRYLNQDGTPTAHGITTLDEAFEHLKNRCYINVDKFALYMEPIAKTIHHHGIEKQIVVKTKASTVLFDEIEKIAPALNYIAIIKNTDSYTPALLKRNIQFIGVEAVFETEDAPVCQPEYISKMQEQGLILWGNGIVYNYKHVLSAGHNDDISITGNPDAGWGWLIDRGFNIIQTDWPLQLKQYMSSKKDILLK